MRSRLSDRKNGEKVWVWRGWGVWVCLCVCVCVEVGVGWGEGWKEGTKKIGETAYLRRSRSIDISSSHLLFLKT